MQQLFYATALVALLAACQIMEDVGAEQGDALSYRTSSYGFTGDEAGSVRLVYKLYEDGGKVAICGFLSANPTGFGKVLTEQWFAQATIVAITPGGEATPLGSGSFLKVREPGETVYNGEARCVRSTVPWKDDFEEASVVAQGPRRVRAVF